MVYYRDDSGSHWKVSVMAMSLKAHLKALFLDLWEGWITLSYTLACIWADMVKWLFSPVSWKRLALSPCLVSSDRMLERQLWRRARCSRSFCFSRHLPGSAFKCPGPRGFLDICPSGFPHWHPYYQDSPLWWHEKLVRGKFIGVRINIQVQKPQKTLQRFWNSVML